MRRRWLLLIAALWLPEPVSAQQVARAVQDLPSLLQVGQLLRVTDESGRSTLGKLVAVSGTEVVLSSERFLKPRVSRTFAATNVRRVVLIDSCANGMAAGAAIGASVGLIASFSYGGGIDEIAFWLTDGIGLVSGGMIAGFVVDRLMNRTVFDGSLRTSQVRVVPSIGRTAQGVALQIRF